MGRTQARLIRKFLQQIVQNTRTTAGIYTKTHQIWNGSRAIESQTDTATHSQADVSRIFSKIFGSKFRPLSVRFIQNYSAIKVWIDGLKIFATFYIISRLLYMVSQKNVVKM